MRCCWFAGAFEIFRTAGVVPVSLPGMTPLHFRSTVRAGLGFLAVAFLAGCTGAPRWGNWSRHPSAEQLATPPNRPAPRVQYADGVYGTQR